MYAYGSDHMTRVAGASTSSGASSNDGFSMQGERKYQVGTGAVVASESRESCVAASIQEGMTTLMLIDLPYALTLADLRDEMELLGFARSYDFIFYPKERKQNFRGYCFVNFISTAEAQRFALVFVDHKFELFPSPKLSNVRVSRSQGLQENFAKIKPGATRYNNFFVDWARFPNARVGNLGGYGRGWHDRYTGAQWNYAYRPHESYEGTPSEYHGNFAYQ
eukprot:TRINITY_DN27535_c0_g1_i1.p1 TRINITY_DN27535_c0_g1~~TRINITY_DN27535_c0_g1_i1.p1  ORF type:complete len:221 (-),score=29.54 TRINITY_DN27535_c0_g1_i1:512-1174(-)